jgi:hypothetical protein
MEEHMMYDYEKNALFYAMGLKSFKSFDNYVRLYIIQRNFKHEANEYVEAVYTKEMNRVREDMRKEILKLSNENVIDINNAMVKWAYFYIIGIFILLLKTYCKLDKVDSIIILDILENEFLNKSNDILYSENCDIADTVYNIIGQFYVNSFRLEMNDIKQ